MRIQSVEELQTLHQNNQPLLALRRAEAYVGQERIIMVCGGTGCHSAQSKELKEALAEKIKEHNLEALVDVKATGCFGFCAEGPIIRVFPDDVFYVKVTPEDAEDIIVEHMKGGKPVERLLFTEPSINEKVPTMHDISFYKKQLRIALRNCGIIDPEEIDEYIAAEGYLALAKVFGMEPEAVTKLMTDSGLRGRGGAGFPTGMKWEATRRAAGDQKYIICNADEGDPGAFMDRSLLEGDPHSIIEAMAIAGYAIGADTGYVYIRAEYPLAIERLEIAIKQARERGLLGENILGSGFNFDVLIKYGAGAFVCGEETALMRSIEGMRGEPFNKTVFPSERGLWGKPTSTNNVETFANVPIIVNKGADWYNSIGTATSKGTKVFALGGKVSNVGLVEVPMGTTLRELVYDIGGGIPNDRALKAVQTGGPSGGCIPTEFLDTPIDYESLQSIGSMMGSGGMIVLDEDDCMVNIAKFYLEFTCEESCGKCTPCRIGTTRLLEMLEKITSGKGTLEDLDKLQELSEVVIDSSLCGLGKTAPNPIVSTIKYFRDEYEAHIVDQTCPAHVCKDLLQIVITDKCIGCTKCSRVCPVDAIEGSVKQLHVIDQETCIKCEACISACPVNAIIMQ
ncbi:NADH-quinone oxidoreductase subunit NuoF [Culicoidibacter larvae]|uniref:NADH-quinone oxidoreductase subunit NuoF n=1 Tax=Culicoidibacter larvae TaxID=2579976 RepID=A0A5R8QB21_9FIRM|nr:NADH-quinone oxidoreductase subunit NuoF [Culicoidibacter larvae]TLG73781.1 NADH-quinone oxidoreductase subunit NuoF [Culicoidibacter larvae]